MPATLSSAASGRATAPRPQVARVPIGALGADYDALVAGHSPALSRAWLTATGADPVLTVRVGQRLMATARLVPATMVGRPLGDFLDGSRTARAALRGLGLADTRLRLPLLVCGEPTLAGPHGLAFAPDATDAVRAALVAGLDAAARRHQPAVRGVLIKELVGPLAALDGGLCEAGFCGFSAGPGMVLPLDPAWRAWPDVLAAYTSKYRVKANRADALSAAVRRHRLTGDALVAALPALQGLYDQVLARADAALGRFDLAALPALTAAMGDRYCVWGYRLGDRWVGVATALSDGDTLWAHLVGLDYGVNGAHGVYPRLLNDYVRTGLAGGVSRVDFGRTAEEIKSTLGAVAVPQPCCLRFVHPVAHRLLPAVARATAVPTARERRPFRQAWYAAHGGWAARTLGVPRARLPGGPEAAPAEPG